MTIIKITKRNPILVLLFSFVTFGIYFFYWLIKTKDEINELGADIPTGWFLIIPLVNIYWFYEYAKGFSEKVVKDKNAPMWFLILFFLGWLAAPIFQHELNKR